MDAPAVQIRSFEAGDVAWAASLNNSLGEAMPHLGDAQLRALVDAADVAWLAHADDAPLGFLLAMRSGRELPYDDYRWWNTQLASFWYVERVAVATNARGLGVGRRFYERLEAQARGEGVTHVVCEVVAEPLNVASMAFHETLGFRRREERVSASGRRFITLARAL